MSIQQHIAMGQLGSFFEDSNDTISGKKIVAITFLEDSTFTYLEPASSDHIGTALDTSGSAQSVNGDEIDTGNVFPTGMTIHGEFTGFKLATGSVICYFGSF